MITIFSRPIRSGKTTELLNFCETADDVGGILMPDKGKEKQFYDIASQEYFSASAGDNEKEAAIITVGQFNFSRTAFERACYILESSAAGLVIVDEVGKLELAGEGFHKAILKLVSARSANEGKDLLLVVRDSLFGEVVGKYGLRDARIIHDLSGL